MPRFISPVPKYTIEDNSPIANGLLFFKESGTNTDKDTFADVNETITNPNPLMLNGDGSVPNCFFSGSAKVILTTNTGTRTSPITGVQQWERDPVSPATSAGAIGADWDAVSIYDINDVVELSGVLYISIVNSNQNNNPSSSPSSWTQFDLLKRWNTNETYALGDPITFSSIVYISLTTSNQGNSPDTNPTNWESQQKSTVTMQKFLASATWTKPAGVRTIIVEAVGGGGAGGGSTVGNTGNSGGAGAYVRSVIDVTAVSSYAVAIGAAAVGGSGAGPNGVDTTVGVTIVVADAGSGGTDSEAGGGEGGTVAGSTGDFRLAGGAGGVGDSSKEGAIMGGGNGFFGGGGFSGSDQSGLGAGGPGAANTGAGGGGALGTTDGGDGGTGVVIITEYK